MAPVFDALVEVGLAPECVGYRDEVADQVRSRLAGVDGVLVWVDPVTESGDRTKLDSLLREVASSGVWVSAHPDTIVKMGTKEVLFDTQELGWGSETFVYRNLDDFADQFPSRLRGGARVLKPCRGNGGIGVQKVELVVTSAASGDVTVRVQGAENRGEATQELSFAELSQRTAEYFADSGGAGLVIDQPFQPRIREGIVRCYLVKSEVVGFARQYPSEPDPATDPVAPRRVFGLPSAKTMYAPDEPAFRRLRALMERRWVPAMQALVDVDDASLPMLWDADFLLGPKSAIGDDTYVLCEINVSSVLPFPPETPAKLARAVLAAV